MDWREQAANSHYQTAVAIQRELLEGHYEEASKGMQELIDALSRSEKRALRSHLIRLMANIIKWNTQPERRSRSWRATIKNTRREIADIQGETPRLNRSVIESLWTSCFDAANEEAEGEMNRDSPVAYLSWEEVFVRDYELDPPAGSV